MDIFNSLRKRIIGKPSPHYGHGYILRKWMGYPSWLPMNIQIQHGIYGDSIPDLWKEENISLMLVWSERMAELWRRESKKPVYVTGAPFVRYREFHEIEKREEAAGTIVFPNHSTPNFIETYSAKDFCRSLEKLPGEYKPVTVCLHYRDIDSYGPAFESQGYKVVTAGNGRQEGDGFVRKFYEILSAHKYCCSNEIGSYTYYSVEMGIPFFLCGPASKVYYRDIPGKLFIKGEYIINNRELFSPMVKEITEEQRDFVYGEIGKSGYNAPESLYKVILRRLFLYEVPRYPIRLLSIFPLLIGKVSGRIKSAD